MLGVLLLAANAGVFSWIQWRTMWPVIFIGLGVILLGRQSLAGAAEHLSAPPYAPPPASAAAAGGGGVVGPLILIFIGGVFLLQNTGYLPPNFWINLWRLWPVVLVLAGIELLLAHRVPWLVLAGLAAVVLVVGAVAHQLGHVRRPTDSQRRHAAPCQTDLAGATQAAVTVRFGAGELDIGPLAAAAARPARHA